MERRDVLRNYFVPLPFRGYACPGSAATMHPHDWAAWTKEWFYTFGTMRTLSRAFARWSFEELETASKIRQLIYWGDPHSPYLNGNKPSQVRKKIKETIDELNALEASCDDIPKKQRRTLTPDQLGIAQHWETTMTHNQLKAECQQMGLPSRGSVKVLARRIAATYDV